MTRIELRIDVTEAAGLGEEAAVALTVDLPDVAALSERPVVCFGKPGGGYSKGYYTEDLPGPGKGAQSVWHTERGWVFVSIDHLGVGSSTLHPCTGERLDFTSVAAGNFAAEQEVLRRLADGSLAEGFPPIASPVTIGIGQSMGGCLTIIQQGRYHCYDGVGILGFSAIHTHPLVPPGVSPLVSPWIPRDVRPSDGVVLNGPALAAAQYRVRMAADVQAEEVRERAVRPSGALAYDFHFDDVDPELIALDVTDFPQRQGRQLPWSSATIPATVSTWCLTPGAVLPEAASITSPVLVAMGERDNVVDPDGEPRAFKSARSVDLFVCPRMAHMHNFAGTRELLWQRIATWGEWVRVCAGAGDSTSASQRVTYHREKGKP